MADAAAEPTTPPPAAPPAPAAPGFRIVPLDFIVTVPDLRNGTLATIQQAAPKASIDAAYKWAAVTGLTPAMAVDAVEYMIRGAYAVMLAAEATTPAAPILAEMRRKAIVLGAIRAGAMAAYNLTVNDMTVTECAASGYAYVNGRIVDANGGGTAGGRFALAQGMAQLDRQDAEVISMLVYLGMAVPALQGASLVATGHHYLPTTRNVFAGQKRQAFGLIKEQARSMLDAMGETFDDMAFHKACHPISPAFKRRMAKDSGLAARLQASGHGAAAIRLPALPSDAAIGKTGVALVLAAKPTIESMGHSASADVGASLIKDLEAADEGVPEREAIQAIQEWAASHSATFAFCAGIVQQVHESTGAGRNTLLVAYSVRKLMAENITSVQRGIMYARASAAKLRKAMEDGEFPDPAVFV